MSEETRVERWLDRIVERATTPRGAALVIATVSTGLAVAAGIAVRLLDHDGYDSIWDGLLFAAQTVTTVGYGDHVPTNAAGKIVAVVVMLFGVAFLTVVTALITSTFVSRARQRQGATDAEKAIAEQLRQLDARLERIEAALRGTTSP